MAKKDSDKERKNSIETILTKERIIMLFDVIENEVAKEVVEELIKLDHLANAPIKIYINSPGGSCTAGLSIIDAMTGCRSRIITVIIGEACSMAGIISIYGDERLITENSYWMGHPMSGGNYDYMPHLKDRVKWLNMLDIRINKILRERTSLDAKELKKCEHGELWLTAEEALVKNVCDEVLAAPLVRGRIRTRRRRKNSKRKKS